MDLDDWRRRIDDIDEQLVRLLNERAECALAVAEVKRSLGMDVYNAVREAEVLKHVRDLGQGPLEPEALVRVFERIIDEARRLERLAREESVSREQT